VGIFVERRAGVGGGVVVAQVGEATRRGAGIGTSEAGDDRRDEGADRLVELPGHAAIRDAGARAGRAIAGAGDAGADAKIGVGAVGDDRAGGVTGGGRPGWRIGDEGVADRRIELVAGAAEAAEELDRARITAGDVGDQLLEQAKRAGAAAVVDRLGDIETLGAGVEAGDEAGGEQVADVGDHPVVAGLDRLVFPHPVDAAAEHRELRADAVEQFLKRAGHARHRRVLRAVNPRQERPQLGLVPGLIEIISHWSRAPG